MNLNKMYSKSVLSELENKLIQGNIIILYDLVDVNLLLMIAKRSDECNQKIEIWVKDKTANNIRNVQTFSLDFFEEIKKYYYMYEFTDQVILLSENNNYPSMMNLVRHGIISEDEMVDAIIYKIAGNQHG